MSEVINLADRKPQDRNRQSIEVGKLVDINDTYMCISKMVRDFRSFMRKDSNDLRSALSREGCDKLQRGINLMNLGLADLYADAGLIEPLAPEEVDDLIKYEALVKDCRDARSKLAMAFGAFARFVDEFQGGALEDDQALYRAASGFCDALDIINASVDAFDTAERRIFKSTTSEA
ncbi:hypothetical protein [Rhizobium leguminosarum]|uniref:hypothetical protein n=1 Tax=Rhizobium leguminosarum TaxID=384 RepID=UPI001030B90F|nr:hypothetical protein [Rhizobium leguminosarum]TBG52632.1 hypothetical protein ELG74_36685 [Rhizobium leguminosarum]